MPLPDLGTLLAALISGGLAVGVLLLLAGLRGFVPDPTRPPGRGDRLAAALRNPLAARQIAVGVAVAVAVLLLTRWPVAAGGIGALAGFWPVLFGGGREEGRQVARLEALVVWTESLRDTVSGHASLEQAIPVTAQNAPPLIRPALIRLVGQLQARVPLERALLTFAGWLNDPSADLTIAALMLNAQRRGDGLAAVLTGLSLSAREELDMRRRVSAGRAGLRRGVMVIIGITLLFSLFLAVFGGAYVQPYDSVVGQVMLAVVLGLFTLGFTWMRRLSGSKVIAPFLARPGQRTSPEDLAVVSRLTGSSAMAVAALAAQPQTDVAAPGNGGLRR